jgi:thiol-disulfide isomerase/thioredoxin
VASGRSADGRSGATCRVADSARCLAVALVAIASWSSAGADRPPVTALLETLDLVGYRSGTRSPRFSAHTVDGRPISLADVTGKVVIVNFWASWCADCRSEMMLLEALHRRFEARGLAIIGVNVQEDARAVERYASALSLSFPIVLDGRGETRSAYGVIGVPTTFVVGRDGRAVAFGVGPRDWGSPPARALVEALLAEAPLPAP